MNYYKKQNQDPRQITARFNSVCKETGTIIKKYENCIYYPSTKDVFCMESQQATTFFNYMQDLKDFNQNY